MRKRPLALAAVFFIVIEIIISGGLLLFKRSSPLENLLRQHKKINAVVIGRVIKREDKEKSQCLYLKSVKIIIDDQIYNESKILAYTGKNQQIKIGNQIRSLMNIEYIKGPRNPGNFDEKKYYEIKGICLKAYGKNYKIIDDKVNVIQEAIQNIRLLWKNNIQESLNEKYSGILMAVLTGDKSSINKDTKMLYSKNGIGHILAISGLHMSFVGMAVYNVLRKFNRSFLTSAWWGTLVLFLYCFITGNSVSAKRAFVMYIVRTGAEVTGRTYDMPVSICIGLMTILTINMRYLNDPGFLLSFSALTGIGIVYPCIKNSMGKFKYKKCVLLFLPGLCINLVSIPITLYFFYEYPLYSVLLNLFIIPFMSVVMILGITGSILSLILPGKFNVFFKGCQIIFVMFEKSCQLFSKLPFWRIVTGKINVFGILIYYSVLILFLVYISNKDKKGKIKLNSYINIMILLVLCLFFSSPLSRKLNGRVDITMIDVGQGDGIYIKDHLGYNYFVDGGSTDIKDPGENRIIPFLLSKGVDSLDYCFITHGDNDHKNAIEEMLKDQECTIKIKRIILPEKKFWDKGLYEVYKEAKKNNVKVFTLKKGMNITRGRFSIKYIFPGDEYSGPVGNAASMVFMLEYRDFKMLFTGDLEAEGERMVENDPCLEEINVLKTAHHGSDGSTSLKFLEKTSPDIALISCGIDNKYGHPGKKTLDRLRKSGAKIYCTNEKGAINIITNGKRIKVTTFLQ